VPPEHPFKIADFPELHDPAFYLNRELSHVEFQRRGGRGRMILKMNALEDGPSSSCFIRRPKPVWPWT
jgi:hypothetical protein